MALLSSPAKLWKVVVTESRRLEGKQGLHHSACAGSIAPAHAISRGPRARGMLAAQDDGGDLALAKRPRTAVARMNVVPPCRFRVCAGRAQSCSQPPLSFRQVVSG